MSKIIVLCSILIIAFSSFSQGIKPKDRVANLKARGFGFESVELFEVNTDRSISNLPETLKEYSCFLLNQDMFNQVRNQQPEAISMSLPIGINNVTKLNLVKSEFKTSDYQVIEMPSGKPIKEVTKNVHYLGIIEGDESSLVSISFVEGQIMGFISTTERKGNLTIGKLLNSDKYIVYNDLELDLSTRNDLLCRTSELNMPIQEYAEQILKNTEEKAISKCPRIFFDLSTVFVNSQGGATNAANYLDGVFAQVVALYANENINLLTTGSAVWSSAQPFADDLSSYTSYRNANGFNGDLGHLIVASGGGVAYLGGICSPVYNYGLSGLYGSYYSVPTYSWSVGVIAHELGHNFGSNHTHACVWNGNGTAIDGCYTMEGSCGYPGVPTNGGTVMSYCHLGTVGINFSYGFGPQPGNVMRNVIVNSQCLTTCNGNDPDLCLTTPQYQSGITYYNGDYVIYANNLFQLQYSNWVYIKSCTPNNTDLCTTSEEWNSNTSYYAGDYVVFAGNLYQYDGTNWIFVKVCGSTSDLCTTTSEWQPGMSYSSGDYVKYENDIYQNNGAGWDFIQSCSSMYAIPGEHELLEDVQISIYPNPITGNVLNVFVSSKKIISFSVYNQDGKLINTGAFSNGQISFDSLVKGLYILELVSNDGEIIQKKFVKN